MVHVVTNDVRHYGRTEKSKNLITSNSNMHTHVYTNAMNQCEHNDAKWIETKEKTKQKMSSKIETSARMFPKKRIWLRSRGQMLDEYEPYK